MSYVSSACKISDGETISSNPCLFISFDRESYKCETGPTKEEHMYRYQHFVTTLFNRVTDETFNSSENEYRIMVRSPRMLYNDGTTVYGMSHPQRVTINGEVYKVKRTQRSYATRGVTPIDLRFVPEKPRLRRLELLDVVKKGLEVTPVSEFESIDIRDTAIRYGYIGDLEQCRSFVQRELYESGPLPEEDENNHYFHGNWDDYQYVVEGHHTWDDIKGFYRPTDKGYYDN